MRSDYNATFLVRVFHVQLTPVSYMLSVLLKGQQVFAKIFHNEENVIWENEIIMESSRLIATQNSKINYYI